MSRLLPVVMPLSVLLLACAPDHGGAELETAASGDSYWEEHCAGLESSYAFEFAFDSVIEDWATLTVSDLESGRSYDLSLYHVADSSGSRVFAAGEDVVEFDLEPEEYDADGLATDLFLDRNERDYQDKCSVESTSSSGVPVIEQAMVLAVGDGPWPVSITSICHPGNSDLRARAEIVGCVLP